MNESRKFNFNTFVQTHLPKEKGIRQYLNDWSHLHLSQESCPVSYQKIIMKNSQMTHTMRAIASILLPETTKMAGSLNRNSSSIIFWSTILSQSTPEINLTEIKNAIRSNYKALLPKVELHISIDMKPDLLQIIKDISTINKDLSKRTIVHFISDLSPDFNSQQKRSDQFRQLREIIKLTYQCGLHIIDCNQAGIFYPYYQEILKDTEFTMQHKDLFVFFSCLENQKVPKLPGLPNDLFSSFLISPIKTALLFHSWHYFGFNHSLNFKDYSIFNTSQEKSENISSQFIFKSSLSPLTVEQVNEAPKQLLDNLMNTLRRLVEAMLYESDFFSVFFRLDDTVADIFTGFAIAQHYLSSFQIKPFSYPAFPETVANHPLWSTFDLRLDAALMTITYGNYFNSLEIKNSNNNDEKNDSIDGIQSLSDLYSINNIPFIEQELQTIKILIESDSPLSEFAGHITFMPNCLMEIGLMKDSIDTLADFIEKEGLSGIQLASKFPIFPSLVQIAKNTVNDKKTKTFAIDENIDVNKLILCMSKLYVFYPNAKNYVSFFNNQYLTSFTVFHLRSDKPLSSLVLFTLMLKLSDSSVITLFLKCNWISITECLIQSQEENVRIWTLLFVSSFASYIVLIDQILQLLDAISVAVDDPSPAVRVAFLVALQSIPFGNSTQIESSVLEIALKLMNDLHPAVRRELASLLVSMKILQKASSLDNKSSFNEKMTSSTSMSTSDFFSESGSDANLEATANGISNNSNDQKKKIKSKTSNISSFSFSTKSEINKIISSQDTCADENNGNPHNQKIILNALKQLSTDPFKAVTYASLIHDDETQRNFTFMQFFNHYISPSNSPFFQSNIIPTKLNSEPQLRASSSKSEFLFKFTSTTDFKRAKIENLLSMSTVVGSNHVITSNVTFSPFDDQLIFGTDEGFVVSYSLQQPSPPNGQNVINGFMSQSLITHVQCDDNNGFPLILITNNSGDFFAGDFSSIKQSQQVQKKLPILTSFRVFLSLHSTVQHQSSSSSSKSKVAMHSHSLIGNANFIQYDFNEPAKRSYEFEYNSTDSRLYFYAPKTGCNINICDLISEKKIGEIISLKDNVTCVNSPAWLSNCVIVCNDDFYLYDCRESLDVPVLSYSPLNNNKVFNCRTFKKEQFILPICNFDGSVSFNDLRMMDRNQSKVISTFDSPFADAQSLCFDVSQETLAAAVGTTKGGYACFYPNDKKIVIPNKSRMGQKIFRLKWMNNKPGVVIMQNYTDIQSCIFS